MRSRYLKGIRQQRLASREQLKAVGHTLQMLYLDFKSLMPADASRLRPVVPGVEVRVKETGTPAYVFNTNTGEAKWDTIHCKRPDVCDSGHVRLVLEPDEGGPLFCAFNYMATRGYAVGFIRDELLPGRDK